MNKVSSYQLNLSVPRKYEYFYDPCKYIFFPTPEEGVYLSFTDGGYLFDTSKINEFYFPHGIEGFYITNEVKDKTIPIILVNCGMKFTDAYSYAELKEIVSEINTSWKKLLGVST